MPLVGVAVELITLASLRREGEAEGQAQGEKAPRTTWDVMMASSKEINGAVRSMTAVEQQLKRRATTQTEHHHAGQQREK